MIRLTIVVVVGYVLLCPYHCMRGQWLLLIATGYHLSSTLSSPFLTIHPPFSLSSLFLSLSSLFTLFPPPFRPFHPLSPLLTICLSPSHHLSLPFSHCHTPINSGYNHYNDRSPPRRSRSPEHYNRPARRDHDGKPEAPILVATDGKTYLPMTFRY